MGFLSNLILKNYSLSDFDRDIRTWFGGNVLTKSGTSVGEHSAMRHVTVYSCVRVRSETFGSLPVSVYKKRPNGKGRDEDITHPIYELLHSVPNRNMTSMTFRETMNGHLDLSGNCYALKTYNRRGQVIDLQPWPWDHIEPKLNEETRELEYHVNDRGKIEVWPAEMVFHVPGLGYDGIRGYSTIQLAREYIGLGLAVNEFTDLFYGQGMNVGSVFTTDQTLNKDRIEELRSQFDDQYAGLRNSHKPFILHSGLTYSRIPMPLKDAQLIETLKLNKEDICGLYRVPPHMIANLDRSTNNNIEHQGIEYVMYTMLPLVTRWEQTANWKLFTRKERQDGYYVKFNLDALLRGDSAARAEYLSKKRQNGVINANEWRELDDQNPIDGVAGDAYLVNGTMISTETAAKSNGQKGGGQ